MNKNFTKEYAEVSDRLDRVIQELMNSELKLKQRVFSIENSCKECEATKNIIKEIFNKIWKEVSG